MGIISIQEIDFSEIILDAQLSNCCYAAIDERSFCMKCGDGCIGISPESVIVYETEQQRTDLAHMSPEVNF